MDDLPRHGLRAVAWTLLLLAGPLRAQGVRIVEAPGLGSLPDIQSAVDAAADGDTLLVAPGSYAGFVIDGKQLAVLATVEGAVVVDGTVEVRNLNGSRATLVAGLDVTGKRVITKSDPGLRVQDSNGHVRLQSCVFRGGRGLPDIDDFGDGGQGAIVTSCTRVAFVDCELWGGDGYGIDEGNFLPPGGDGGLGVRTSDSSVALYDCLARGGKGGNAGIDAGDGGIGGHVLDLGIFASGCTFQGGAGGFAWDFLDAFGGDGGDGLRVASAAQAQLVDNVYTPGAAGGSVITPGLPGQATSGGGIFNYHAGQARTFAADYLAPEGEPWQVDVSGEPGDWVFLAKGIEPAWIVPFPKTGIWLVPLQQYFQWPPLAVLPPAGTATIQLPGVGAIGPEPSRTLFGQGWIRDPDQGYGRLGSPLHRVLLDRESPPDCDASGVNDLVELLKGELADCNGDLEPDLCEIASGAEPDCNANLVPDVCDLAAGTSTDCNANGVLDECEALPDCNGNNVPDPCDILNGTSLDQNVNGIPDECEGLGTTWFCAPDALPGGSGSLEEPFDQIVDAVTAAQSGDRIVLLDGVFQGPGNRDFDFQGKQLVLRGKNGPSACTIDFEGNPGLRIQGFQTAATRVEGLTLIRGSKAIQIKSSSPVVSQCVISDCSSFAGAAIDMTGSDARIEDCQLRMNTSSQPGGGGSLDSSYSNPTIVRCLFEQNTAPGGSGGAILINGTGELLASHCVFRNNAADDGGAIGDQSIYFGTEERLQLDDCLFEGNQAVRGGAIFADTTFFPAWQLPMTLTGCTFGGNTASSAGGAVFATDGILVDIGNSVLWGNTAPAGAQIALEDPTTGLTADFCDVQGGLAGLSLTGGPAVSWGAGNLDADPLFVAPGLGDYRLGPGSPCIDAGANGLVPLDQADIDGDGNVGEPVPLDLDLTPRFVDDPLVPDTGSGTPPLVDLGAYEAD